MRVMVIGASGVIGTRLVSQLRQAGHGVIGTSRSPERAQRLRLLGAQALVLDAARQTAVRRIVAQRYAPVRYARQGGPVKREDDPLDASPPPPASGSRS